MNQSPTDLFSVVNRESSIMKYWPCLILTALLSLPTLAQVSVYVPASVQWNPTAGALSRLPFDFGAPGSTLVQVIPASSLNSNEAVISDISLYPRGSGTWVGREVSIGIGHWDSSATCPFDLPNPRTGALGEFLDITYVVQDATWSFSAIADSWSPFGLERPFRWNGQDDVAIFMTHSSGGVTSGSWDGRVQGTDSGVPSTGHMSWEGSFLASTTASSARCQTHSTLAMQLVMRGDTEWQLNSQRLYLDHDGIQTDGYRCPVVAKCTGDRTIWNQGGQPGLLVDAIVAVSPPVPGSDPRSVRLNDGQLLNVDRAHPSVFFLYPGFTPLASWSIPFNANRTPIEYTAQYFAIDFTAPSLLRLSQVLHMDVNEPATGPQPGPTGDDDFVAIDFVSGACIGEVSFYGTRHDLGYFISNGRMTFGASDTDFSASIADAASGEPFFGYWTDLNPALGGALAWSVSGNSVRMDYTGVRYYGYAANNTLSLSIDVNGLISMDVSGIASNLGGSAFLSNAALFGISPGSGLSPTMTPVTFTAGGSGGVATPNEMLFDFSSNPSVEATPGFLDSVASLQLGTGVLSIQAGTTMPTWVGM